MSGAETGEPPALPDEVWRVELTGAWYGVDAYGVAVYSGDVWVSANREDTIIVMRAWAMTERARADRAEAMCGAAVETSCADVAARLAAEARADRADADAALGSAPT